MENEGNKVMTPEIEVLETVKRRTFSNAYKLSVLEQADRCTEPGDLGKLLRCEGLYSSHLAAWRAQRHDGSLEALGRKRGPKAKVTPEQRDIEKLQRENERLRRKLEQAERIIDIQKKLSEILEVPLQQPDADDN